MGDVGACWDNAVVERFFGSLKHEWIFKVAQTTREHMKNDVAAYMKYYNLVRLHTPNGDQSSINSENSLKKCPVGLGQYICATTERPAPRWSVKERSIAASGIA